MSETKLLEKIKHTHFVFSKVFFFSRVSCLSWDNVQEYGKAVRATNDNIIRHIRIACWITKATDTHSEYVTLFHCNNGCTKAAQCYLVRILTLVLFSK